jgi:hypothetical protein
MSWFVESNCRIIYFTRPLLGSINILLPASTLDIITSMEATSSKVYCSAFGTKKIAYCCDYLDNYRSAQEVMIQVIITLAIFTDYQLECQSLLIKSLHQFYLLKLTDRTKIKEMGRNRI